MIFKTILLLVVLVSMVTSAVVPSEKSSVVCGSISATCTKSQDCCSGCCTEKKCSDCSHSPCTFYHCPEKKKCYLEQVTCIQAPCNPVPACRSEDSDYDNY